MVSIPNLHEDPGQREIRKALQATYMLPNFRGAAHKAVSTPGLWHLTDLSHQAPPSVLKLNQSQLWGCSPCEGPTAAALKFGLFLGEEGIAGALWRTCQPSGCLTRGGQGSRRLDGQPKEQAGLVLLRYTASLQRLSKRTSAEVHI